ncbi:amidase signature domain-containing protein [Lipomyces japonicus]|uniref:amidase signature domain-containing protein n=1 Tax=Lipomyces japonicus TaxID=56871 RepID=UPI0034CE0905
MICMPAAGHLHGMTAHSSAILNQARTCLRNISRLNARVNALTAVRPADQVMADVKSALAHGNGNDNVSTSGNHDIRGRLVAFKDNFCTTDGTTTCASRMLRDYQSPFDAAVVELLNQAGAVSVGKANMDEFAMGTDNVYSIYGPPKNPLYVDTEPRSTGGSSGGSAAAVAAGMCFASLGTDTGGSVRLPAAYCGVVGFKPSYGVVSRWGVVPFAQSLDTVGVLSRTVTAARHVFEIISCGHDKRDPTSVSDKLRKLLTSKHERKRKFRIGIAAEFVVDTLSPVVMQGWRQVLHGLREHGHELVYVTMPAIKHALPAYYIIAPAEASSNLARYDGVRYGFRHEHEVADGGVLFGPTRAAGFGAEVRRRILLGNYNLSSAGFDNHYIQAQKVRRLIQLEFDRVFAMPNPVTSPHNDDIDDHGKVDFLVTPCSTGLAPLLADVTKPGRSPLDSYVNDVLTVPASLAGVPAVSVPFRPQQPDGGANTDVVGIQVMGQYGDDYRVLELAQEIEQMSLTNKQH